ncbi:hypothetical protein LRS11_16595 [Pseudomonas sp. J452]|uniref:hypothetical protein n=1 Tax=Pseudomonas sp. J452 TaxID=2898441 RepID=UPI0021ADD337|nr:hypothetical protein [Pseudomonas sp. J452]UUY07434.1 hypothetical protein LRS11_16595 [Pseudomonas sp. J452]
MAKDGISLMDVRIAREELLRQGLKPCVRNIQTKAGGSNTAIQTQLLKLDTMSKGEFFGEQGLLQKIFQDAQRQLLDVFQEEVAIARTEAQSKVEELQAQLNIYRLSSETLLNELTRVLKENENAVSALTKLSERHAAATEMVRKLEVRLDAKTRDLMLLNSEIADTRQTLELRFQQHLEYVQESEERQRKDSAGFATKLISLQAAHENVLAAAQAEFKALQKQLAKVDIDRVALSLECYLLSQTTTVQIADRDLQLITLNEDLKSVRDELSKALEREAAQNAATEAK